ncbi:MAG: phospholipase D-like domain-containing protein [Longimicrobiales bacterium]
MHARAEILTQPHRAPPSFIDQAFSRAAGVRRSEGNAVRVLNDAAENYPAWLDAIGRARRYIYFESYILRDDVAGNQFADALIAKSREGVVVRVLYDWLGAIGKSPASFWRRLRDAGVDVRAFNPFQPLRPFAWVHRDHRKSLVVDGSIGFVTGLCVGDEWVGDAARDIAPWRDTGIELLGPAVTQVEDAFARVWSLAGDPIPDGERASPETVHAGDVALRVVASEPIRGALLRFDQLLASAARRTLWLTDAYFAGMPSHVEALRSAALDGVDVRLLVPGATDIPIVRAFSRAGYRPLLQAGVRVFEWNGPMIHAKTAVADDQWGRIGTSNLNVASWLGNYELDVIIEDAGIAARMSRQFLTDLENATEVMLRDRRRYPRGTSAGRTGGTVGTASRAAAGALRIGNTVTAAVTNRRVLSPPDAGIVSGVGAALVGLGIAALLWPRIVAIPAAVITAWLGIALFARGVRLWRRRRGRDSRMHPLPPHEETASPVRPGGKATADQSASGDSAGP